MLAEPLFVSYVKEEAHVDAAPDERLAANPSHPPQQPVKRGQRVSGFNIRIN